MIDDARDPDAAVRRDGKIGEDRRVFDGDLLLIIVAIRNPRLHLSAVERARNQPLMERMLVVIALLANGEQRATTQVWRYFGA